MNRFYKYLPQVALMFTVILLALGPTRQAAAEARKVLIVPFSIHAEKDLAFLQKGITAMLSSRLTDLGKVTVIDQGAVDALLKELPATLTRETAAEAGRQAGADYVAFGSLTVFGESISTDARFVETAAGALLVTFNETAQNQGEVIGHINRFAAEVNGRIFGRSEGASVSAAEPVAPATPSDPDQVNPEKKIWAGGGGMRIQATDPDVDQAGARLWRSRRFRMNIEGLAMGDLDGDGNTEVVFAGDKEGAVYRYKDGGFLKVTDIELEPRLICIGVDVADINGNGRAEIFVSARSENYFPSSYVLEWDGTAFQTIYDASNLYFRVVWNPQTGRHRLYGQKGSARSVVGGPVFAMSWVGGDYVPQENVILPDEASVFGFAAGDLTGDGAPDTLAFVNDHRLQLSGPGGREEWTSAEPYGGNYTWLITPEEYKEGQRESRINVDPLPLELFFVPQRILLTDFDRDGKTEALVLKNEDSTRGLMSRTRSYREGYFENLAWDNVGMRAVWRTRKFSGFISDYNIGDFDNDGQLEVVFAVVKKVGDPLTGEAKSYLVSWDPSQLEAQAQ